MPYNPAIYSLEREQSTDSRILPPLDTDLEKILLCNRGLLRSWSRAPLLVVLLVHDSSPLVSVEKGQETHKYNKF